jgi:hypothetical protein
MTSIAHIEQDQDFQGESPSAHNRVNAASLDSQFQEFKQRFNDTLDALGLTIRDDDQLADQIVRARCLHPEVAALIASKAGWQPKVAVAVATTAYTSLNGEQTIDGVLTSGSRVLVKNQIAASENGIYVSSSGAWSRATDCDTAEELGYAFVIVSAGATNIETSWVLTSDAASIELGTTSLLWAQAGGTTGPIPNSKLANMEEATIKGRAAGAGAGKPVDLTPAMARVAMGPWLDVSTMGYINAIDPAYGADPTGATDSAAAIQAAIDAAFVAGSEVGYPGFKVQGGVVILPKGEYGITVTLVIKKGVVLRGQGRAVTRIFPLAGFAGTALVKLGDPTVTGNPQFNSRVEHINLHAKSVVERCVFSNNVQEGGGVFECLCTDFTLIGVDFNSVDDTTYCSLADVDGTELWAGAGAVACVKITKGYKNRVTRATVLANSASVGTTFHGIVFANTIGHARYVHFEGVDSGVYFDYLSSGTAEEIDGGNCTTRPSGLGGCAVRINSSYSGVVQLRNCRNYDHDTYSLGESVIDEHASINIGGICGLYTKGRDAIADESALLFTGTIDIRGRTDVTCANNASAMRVNAESVMDYYTLLGHVAVRARQMRFLDPALADKFVVGTYSPISGETGKLTVSRLEGVDYEDIVSVDSAGTNVGSAWDGPHLLMGPYHLWFDASAKFRFKVGAPTSDTDGTVVGTQT